MKHPEETRAAAMVDYRTMTAREVAKRHGVKLHTVRGWARREPKGPRSRSYTAAVKSAAVAAYRTGMTSTSVADEFGTSAVSVCAWVRAAGEAVRSPGRPRKADETESTTKGE